MTDAKVTISRETLQYAIDTLEQIATSPPFVSFPTLLHELRAALAAEPVEPVALTDEQFDNLVGKVAQIKATMTIDGVETLGMFGAEEAINIVLGAMIAAAGDKP